MIVKTAETLDNLTPYRKKWDQLAGDSVFRSWTWLSTWWQHYQFTNESLLQTGPFKTHRRLYIILVFAEATLQHDAHEQGKFADSSHTAQDWPPAEQLLGILPCYLEQTLTQGRTLRLLGDGDVCSEHLEPLVAAEQQSDVVAELAEYLCQHAKWDSIALSPIDSNRPCTEKLLSELEKRRCTICSKPGPNCWSISLPNSWDDFLARQSKSHRKQLRRLDNRVLNSSRAKWHLVRSKEEFETAWEILVDLHQQRRKSLGEAGCFASPQWANFHKAVAEKLLAAGQLRLSWLELDGKPIAAEYQFADGNTTYAYQGGFDPNRHDEEPGRLSMIRTIQRAIEEGHTTFDLLRGDEPYKPHWRATSSPTNHIRIIPPRAVAHWRHHTWSYIRNVGRLVQRVTNLLG